MKLIIIMILGFLAGCTSDIDILRAEIESMKIDIELARTNAEEAERSAKVAYIKSDRAMENIEIMDKKLDKIWKKTKGDKLP
jgi:predicted Holliday junction resolvase-like endonuclease